MDQYIDNRHKEILWSLLANPADTGQLYTQNLEQLVNTYPQSGILQVMLARAGDKQQLSKAAVYYNPKVLYKLIYNPDDLQEVTESRIVQVSAANNTTPQGSNTGREEVTGEEEVAVAGAGEEEQEEVVIAEAVSEGEVAEEEVDDTEEILDTDPEQIIEEADYMPEAEVEEEEESTDTEPEQVISEYDYMPYQHEDEEAEPEKEVAPQSESVQPDNSPKEVEYFRQDIEDEVYDEIASIDDIGFDAHNNQLGGFNTFSVTEEEEEDHHANIKAQEDQLIMGGIAGGDYLAFDKKLDELRNEALPIDATPTEDVVSAHAPEAEQPISAAPESNNVSRYNDDKMPYSFMWWLDKTRKEYAGSLQPYATAQPVADRTLTEPKVVQPVVSPVQRNTADELQQQYYENIFSLTSVDEIEKNGEVQDVEFDHTKKEDVIIERFIHTEPQIKPLAADKLDNENKAKKSSEDRDELVTETLARIYTDQMLYHKAIATYKKLIVKFPEKKLYFASQIEQLESKTN